VAVREIIILSSIGGNSNFSAIEEAIADTSPISPPIRKPIGTITNAIAKLPIQCLVLLEKKKFLIVPVTPSPKEIYSGGNIASIGLLVTIHETSNPNPQASANLFRNYY